VPDFNRLTPVVPGVPEGMMVGPWTVLVRDFIPKSYAEPVRDSFKSAVYSLCSNEDDECETAVLTITSEVENAEPRFWET
jgi:hypothetical protein